MTVFAIIVVVLYLYYLLLKFLLHEIKASEVAMSEYEAMRERWQSVRDVAQPEINVLALVKGTERYVFLYTDECRADTLRTLGRYASDPELSFTWYDAALLSQKIRQDAQPAA